MAEAVVIGDLELDLVTGIVIDESRKLVVHGWPGEDGDLVQDMGMAAARIRLTGVAVGEEADGRLEQLRMAMQSGEPQDFAASAAVASNIEQVMVVALRVLQPPGRVHYYEYQLELIRYVPPPPPISGFDAGALEDIASAVDAAASAAMGEAAALLGTLEGAAAAIEQGMDAVKDAAALAENALELAQGLKGLEELLSAAGSVIKAYTG
ncbi:hypothetical protein E5161_07195 [Cohnella pontilimi]|uniref:DNA circulation N-terminal domain-containing protein n=1 Tax=Cohnella pontilimi TaxID=2564100 RepID=A0A4U0FD09_9BACL|nr:DNA circularization N-terminal domain-containing protein [Cohnella pontilimi]TJY42631.1 hypothetical protein E5161_07195 [Cohnella pontilimi]